MVILSVSVHFFCLVDGEKGGAYTSRVGAVTLVAVGAFADDACIDVSGVWLEVWSVVRGAGFVRGGVCADVALAWFAMGVRGGS